MKSSHLAALFLILLGRGEAQESPSPSGDDFFRKRIAPVLAGRCFACHSAGAEKLKGGLLLDTAQGLSKGGHSGRAIVPGEPDKSLLIQAVRGADPEFLMPPKGKGALSKVEIADLEAWVRMGAPDPRGKSEAKWEVKDEDIWAFKPLRRPTVPALAEYTVDAFLLRTLAEKNLRPSTPADPATLLRRATYDLTGLPPAPEELDAFARNASPDAFARAVDRLLASPRYGEQAARHWLDVVRYADTAGFSNDFDRPGAWRYRDYVIRSFNADKPFDRFIREQIAGDELDPADPEMLIAVGFLRMGPWEQTGMSVAAVTRQFWLDDVAHATVAAFQGLTLRCARCHDHKFDPIPTRDYYRVQAVFAATHFAERDAPFLTSENTSDLGTLRARTERRLKEKGYREVGPPSEDPLIRKSLEKVGKKRQEHLQRELQRCDPLALSVYNGASNSYSSNRLLNRMPARRDGPVADVHVLRGGALESPGDKVAPGVVSSVAGAAARAIPESADGRRLALADWFASPDNPLTARVIVNRVWQQHFAGKGIVATPNNLGKMGNRPTHPELLDWLAAWFIDNGWSVKKLHRLVMTSAAYRRSAAPADPGGQARVDPANDLLAHFPARRLAAEEIRDSMLALSGELAAAAGGPGVFPEINLEVAHQPRHVMGGPAPAYQPSPRPEERNRRTIYCFRTRTLADPMLEVFNQPGSDSSCERRDETTVPTQVFALFNGQFVHDRALALARRLEGLSADPAARVDLAFRLAYGRAASDPERRRALDHVARMLEHHRARRPQPVEPPRLVRREMIEEFTGDVVRWDEELDLMEGYRRDLKPWDVGPETRALAELCLVILNSNEFLYVR